MKDMNLSVRTWTDLQRTEGYELIDWLRANGKLEESLEEMADALFDLFQRFLSVDEIPSVWDAVPLVMAKCDDPKTYSTWGAVCAYAWLHLLDRYVRTWLALEVLVEHNCLPMGKFGVNTLDVGTGPGPSAFATRYFYDALVEYSEVRKRPSWRQEAHIQCVEIQSLTNGLRHYLAEMVYERSGRSRSAVLEMCSGLHDFGKINPGVERRDRHRQLLREIEISLDDEYSLSPVDEISPNVANSIAQSLHRYRLFTFSNFLTNCDMILRNRKYLLRTLSDAGRGSVLVVLGAKEGEYPQVYEYLDRIAKRSGFRLRIEGYEVSSSASSVADRVYEEGKRVYDYLEALCANENRDEITRRVRRHFEESRESYPSSKVWAYRKY